MCKGYVTGVCLKHKSSVFLWIITKTLYQIPRFIFSCAHVPLPVKLVSRCLANVLCVLRLEDHAPFDGKHAFVHVAAVEVRKQALSQIERACRARRARVCNNSVANLSVLLVDHTEKLPAPAAHRRRVAVLIRVERNNVVRVRAPPTAVTSGHFRIVEGGMTRVLVTTRRNGASSFSRRGGGDTCEYQSSESSETEGVHVAKECALLLLLINHGYLSTSPAAWLILRTPRKRPILGTPLNF